MKPDSDELRHLAPELDDRLLTEHLSRLDEAYFDAFTPEQVVEHVRGLERLEADRPAEVLITTSAITVLAFDHESAFSLVCGVLASTGFGILSGDSFTYAPPAPTSRQRRRTDPFGRPLVDPYRRRRIIDHFTGHPAPDFDETVARQRIETVMSCLERNATSEARHRVNEWVTARLRQTPSAPRHALFPVQVESTVSDGPVIHLRVTSQDTPAFLYAFSTGLSLQGVSIERVRIDTSNSTVHDEIDLLGPGGQPLEGTALDALRVCAVLTKHFTYFLDRAPDPSAALERFNLLVRDFFSRHGETMLDQLADPQALQSLARVLGASDFVWEEFVRVQYESLLPFLRPRPDGQALEDWLDNAPQRLDEAMAGAHAFDDRRQRLNLYKDREAFMIDLEHILSGGRDLARLSRRLTRLAEAVLHAALDAVYDSLNGPADERGRGYALFGLGKLGGASLGYASDLELLLVYRHKGRGTFFADLVQGLTRFIHAKEDGLFQIDLKLRPYSIDGPLATTLDSFAAYYGPGGPAHSLERLSLTRLRAVAGDPELRAEVEALRDQVLYEVPSISLDELRTTRLLQFEQKSRPDSYNAKYSPGALVDVEYAAEILQVLYGKSHPEVRTPRTVEALQALAATEVISSVDLDQLVAAYDFLGRLINGLRMLRGWADDLYLPRADSEEFAHLARRMGYESATVLTASQQLDVEFQSRTAAVRAFVERRFGPSGLPGPIVANAADLVLSDSLPVGVRSRVLSGLGFADPAGAYTNLRRLAGNDERRRVFAQLAVLACAIIGRLPSPDATLDRWRRQVDELPNPEQHFGDLLLDPSPLHHLTPA